jgi:integrase/recombinase XerD
MRESVTKGKPAKLLGPADVRLALMATGRRRHRLRDQVMLLLSLKAGLRAGEIAALTWDMVTDAQGAIGSTIELPGSAAKKGSGRRIPLHSALKAALADLKLGVGGSGPVIVSERGGPMTASSVVNWFASLYRQLGLQGCSSHSGRRTFVTMAARLVSRAGGSLRDVQELAGHRSIKTTQTYIEGDGEAQRRLIHLL